MRQESGADRLGKDGAELPPANDAVLHALVAEPVAVIRPAKQTVPFVFAVPHSGRLYPASFISASRLDALALRGSEDAFVDELFSSAPPCGAPMLVARFPRSYVDVNRAPGEIDSAMFINPPALETGPRTARLAAGLGLFPRVVRDGLEIYGHLLEGHEADFRFQNFYKPYHTMLAALVVETCARFGVAVVVDCHSMPGQSHHADIVLGDCHGASAGSSLIAQAQSAFARAGLKTLRNTPYAGGYTTTLYGRPQEGVHALQIEINRALYLDETRVEKRATFRALCGKIGIVVSELAKVRIEKLAGPEGSARAQRESA
jgi:N-formylglutamate deformylase